VKLTGKTLREAVLVNRRLCQNIAEKIRGTRFRTAKTLAFETPIERENAARLLFFFMAICHDTRGLNGRIEGQYYHGSDYLYQGLKRQWRKNPDLFSPRHMAQIDVNEFLRWLSPEEGLQHCRIRRPEERVRLLRDCGIKLQEHFDGKVTLLLQMSNGHIKRPDQKGLTDLLSVFEAYGDPLAKKTMVLVKLLNEEGLFAVRDPENVLMPIDYHVMRVALRSGMIDIQNEELRQRLRLRRFVSKREVFAIREACLQAYQTVANLSNISVFDVDTLFWQIGRNCCHSSHEPYCGEKACKISHCTLIEAVEYACGGKCILDKACTASYNFDYVRFFEPKEITYYY